jgi:hypothetical protein
VRQSDCAAAASLEEVVNRAHYFFPTVSDIPVAFQIITRSTTLLDHRMSSWPQHCRYSS